MIIGLVTNAFQAYQGNSEHANGIEAYLGRPYLRLFTWSQDVLNDPDFSVQPCDIGL